MNIKKTLALGSVKNKIMQWINAAIKFLRPFSLVNLLFYIAILGSLILFVIFLNSIIFNEAKSATSFGALFATSLTMTTLLYNARRHLSEDYSKDAKEYLKRAHEILEPKGGSEYPPDDRMVWLTAARFLKISERLASQIIMSSHKKTFIEEKQYWRWKIKEYIKNFPPQYYAVSAMGFRFYKPGDKEPLSEFSLYAIHKFIEWDDDYIDPLDDKHFSEEDREKLLRRGYRNLYNLLREVEHMRRKQ